MSAEIQPDATSARPAGDAGRLSSVGERRTRLIGLIGRARRRTGDPHRADRVRAVRAWGHELWEIEQLRRRCVRAAIERDRLASASRPDA